MVSREIYSDLSWLPRPVDFRAQLRALRAGPDRDRGTELRAASQQALDLSQLTALARVAAELGRGHGSLPDLARLRVGIVGNGTLDLAGPAIVASALRSGFLVDCTSCDFGQGFQAAVSPFSAINRAGCDVVVMAFDHRGLPLRPSIVAASDASASVDDAVVFLQQMVSALREHRPGVQIVVQTVAPPPETLFGNLDRQVPGSSANLIELVNQRIVEGAAAGAWTVLDVAGLAQTVGSAAWHSPTHWNLAKLPFAPEYLPLYADHACRVIAALRGRSRRALILDLDNTLWGGVVGDDGVNGIALGEGDPTGEAHLAVQRMALALRERGVVLAVSSKNTDEVARGPFREHPDMLVREDHIAVFQANWNDKATNIRAIADELALGLESLVFLDDNPAERALVRRYLPQVAVPELPEDPALFARVLSASGYFEAVLFSEEDRRRAGYYEGNARRAKLAGTVANMEEYLAMLDMEVDMRPFDPVNRGRIHQLINKSNQFNLTGRRHTEAEVRAFEADPDAFTLQVRLRDRFGDNGMIAVLICVPDGSDRWRVDTWLMSCRVLGRGVERMMLHHLLAAARRAGVAGLIGEYRPTDRNALVRDHYEKLGFEPVDGGEDGATRWRLSTDVAVARPPARYVEADDVLTPVG